MPLTLRRLSLILGLSCLLAACGFQLRGGSSATALPEPWKQMQLDTGNPNSEFARELQARFAANGIIWRKDRGEAAFVLRLWPERFTQRNLSLTSEARASEFELSLKTQFAVIDARSGAVVIEQSEAAVMKQMENDPRNVVGKAEEIRILRSEMRGELARQILRRIGFFAANAAHSAELDET